MLATLGSLPPTASDRLWAYEMKWDGVRTLARIDGGRLGLRSRNDIDMTVAYPELLPLADRLAGRQALLDGEIVCFDEAGRPSFRRLQKRMHVTSAAVAGQLSVSDPAILLVFDLLYLDGRSLLRVPYSARRELLDELALSGPAWQTPPAFTGNGAQAVQTSQEQRLEGVVAKRLSSLYTPGRRSPDWIKVKNFSTQEVLIGGWRPGAGRREGMIGALLLGLPGDDGLGYIGKVGTGFTDAALVDLARRLRPHHRASNPFRDIPSIETRDAHWVEPVLVGEVAFGEWTSDGRLRHPAWRGLRPDKRPDQVVRES